MIRKFGLTMLISCLLLVSFGPGLVQAQSGITILDSTVETEFPAMLAFNLAAESEVNITDIRLHYRVERMEHAQVTSEVYIEIVPDSIVEAEWTWDMKKTGGLPPGSSVQYWWAVKDAAGDKVETKPTQVQFDDNRYLWRSLSQGQVTMYWYKGDDSFASSLMIAIQQALTRLTEYTGAELENPVEIYIYADTKDLQGSMIYPQEWTGGAAFTRYGTIVIGIAPDNLEWGVRTIAHELTHLVIHQMTFNPYGGLATWLDEGLAMYAEGELEPVFVTFLNNAVVEETLISVRSLSSPFSAFAEESFLAYAQSYSLEEFLVNQYGKNKMFELLNTFKEGSGYDEALLRVYGFDMDELNALWRDYIAPQDLPVETGEKGMSPVMIGAIVALSVGFIVMFTVLMMGMRRQK
ncbi:peptidase MA family metallohydrolase [Chloroflexota bacterium]